MHPYIKKEVEKMKEDLKLGKEFFQLKVENS